MATPKKRSTRRAAAKPGPSAAKPAAARSGSSAATPPEARSKAPTTRAATSPARRPVKAAAPSITTPQRAAIDAAFLERRELRRGLSDNLRALRVDSDAVTDRVSRAFREWNPSGLSAEEVDRRNYVAPDADLAGTQTRVIERRIDALATASPGSGMRVRTSGGAGKLVEGVKDKGSITIGPLVKHVADRQDTLIAPPPAPETAVSVAAATADEVVAGIESQSADGKDEKENGAAAPDQGVDEFVDLAVRRQMNSATAPEFRPTFDVIPTGERTDKTQAEILSTFSLQPGASDVESVHDFNVLQIAFEHVWTRIFDGEVESLGRELYKEYVGLKDFLGYDAPDTTITTIGDLRRLMAEIKELSQIAQAQVPATLGGTSETQTPKSSDELEGAARTVGAVATGGLSILVEWAIREFGRIGQKPVLTWDDVDGGVLARGDRITATIAYDAVPDGLVEIVLLTDTSSHIKKAAFQTYVEQTGKFANVVFVQNTAKNTTDRNGVQYFVDSNTFASSLLERGMIEFASEQTSALDTPGRYVLGKLADRLRNRARVTFYWKDN
jgi:hypothetical protein